MGGGKSDCSSKKSEAVGLLVVICGKTTVVCLKYAVHSIDKSVIENKVKLCCEKPVCYSQLQGKYIINILFVK